MRINEFLARPSMFQDITERENAAALAALSVETSLNGPSSGDDSLSLGKQQVVAEQSTYVVV